MAIITITKLFDGSGYRVSSGTLEAADARLIHVTLEEGGIKVETKLQEVQKPKYDRSELDQFYGDE